MSQKETTTTIGDLPTDLDADNAYVVGQTLQTGAEALRSLAKPRYAPAALFLERFAAIMFDLGIAQAQSAGVPMRRSPKQAQEALDKAAKRHLN